MKIRALCHAVSAAAILASAAAATPARAADISAKAPAAPAAPLPPFALPNFDAWSGVYVGIEGGYAWGRQKLDGSAFPGLNLDSLPTNGGLYGGFAGAQKQFGNWVFGIEADFDGASLRGAATASLPTTVTSGMAVPGIAGQLAPVTGTAFIAPTTGVVPGSAPFTAVGMTGQVFPGTDVPVISDVPLIAFPGHNITNAPVFVGDPTAGIATGSGARIGTVTIPEIGSAPVTVTVATPPGAVAIPGQVATVVGTATVAGQPALEVTNIAATTTVNVNTRIDELASVRGKVGYALSPTWLIYGTGGLALAHARTTVTATQTFVADLGNGPQIFNETGSASGGATLLGWAAGAGIDWKWAGTNWVFGAEYLHYDFPQNTIGLNDGSLSVSLANTRQSFDAVKGRISYLFPIH